MKKQVKETLVTGYDFTGNLDSLVRKLIQEKVNFRNNINLRIVQGYCPEGGCWYNLVGDREETDQEEKDRELKEKKQLEKNTKKKQAILDNIKKQAKILGYKIEKL